MVQVSSLAWPGVGLQLRFMHAPEPSLTSQDTWGPQMHPLLSGISAFFWPSRPRLLWDVVPWHSRRSLASEDYSYALMLS